MSHNIDLPIHVHMHACTCGYRHLHSVPIIHMHAYVANIYLHSVFSAIVYSCWLSTKKGVIWAFVAPMLVIILVSNIIIIVSHLCNIIL